MEGRLFSIEGAHCRDCPLKVPCGAAETDFACPEFWGDPGSGGESGLHPVLSSSWEWIRAVHGAEFDSVKAQPTDLPKLARYLAQIRARSELNGQLRDAVYGVRLSEVLLARGIRPAAELRAIVGLSEATHLIVLPFDDDALLERFWSEGDSLLPALAKAGYGSSAVPSYSLWTPRSRMEHLLNMKRPFEVFAAMQHLGMRAILRVGWVIDQDARRMADWINQNTCVNLVAIDWCTYRRDIDWNAQLAGLAIFDAMTGGRLHYLINGPSTASRFADVYRILAGDRVCFTNATFPPPPETAGSRQRRLLPDPAAPERARAFRDRRDQQEELVKRALGQVLLQAKVEERPPEEGTATKVDLERRAA